MQSPAIVVITNTRGDIEYVNPRLVEITGYSGEEVRGRRLRLTTWRAKCERCWTPS